MSSSGSSSRRASRKNKPSQASSPLQQDDDASIAARNDQIEEMRARVEQRLQTLLAGDPLSQLKKQVQALRGSTREVESSRDSEQVDEEESYQESSATRSFGESATESSYYSESLASHDRAGAASMSSSSILEKRGLPEPSLVGSGTSKEIQWNPGPVGRQHIQFAPSQQTTPSCRVVESLELCDPYGDKGVYSGQTSSSGRPHGSGQMHYHDGRVYTGQWSDGQWHGSGKVQFANGDVYEGSYVKDQRHGFGVYRWHDGRVFSGNFQADQREGLGEYKWPDGARYKGWFVAGNREGEGTYKFADGSVYVGEWCKGKYVSASRRYMTVAVALPNTHKYVLHSMGWESVRGPMDGFIKENGKWVKPMDTGLRLAPMGPYDMTENGFTMNQCERARRNESLRSLWRATSFCKRF